jgi:hypothetical protein
MHPAPYRRLVRQHTEPITIRRRDEQDNTSYGEQITYSEVGVRQLYIEGVSESRQPTAAGEFQSMSMIAFSLSDEDIRVNDRFDHGSTEFEVADKVGLPDDTDPVVHRYELERP